MKKITHKLFFLISLFMFMFFLHPLSGYALSKEFVWEKNYGGIKADISAEVILSDEKNFIIVGETHSKGAGNSDAWVLKLDEEGNILWEKTYGGEENDGAFSIVETEDHGYIICGYTWSKGKGKNDGWVFKIDHNGKVLWERTFGDNSTDTLFSIIKSKDGEYAAIGRTNSKGAGNSDAWVLKLDEEGNILWEKTYGGEENDGAFSIVETEDHGYIICGYTWSKGNGKDDGWVFKIDLNGKVLWERTFGEGDRDRLYSLIGDYDKGYVAVGYADRVFCSLCSEQGYVWVIKMDETGEQIWEKKFGGSTYDMAYDLIQHKEGGYVIVAKTKDKSKETSAAWLLKLDQKGNILDKIVNNGDKDNYFKSIIKSKDEEYYMVTGDTWYKSLGSSDIWLMKLTK
jgi:uncharacterized protein YunC (DUF1805 family)